MDKKCSIFSVEPTIKDWEQVISEVVKYTSVACDFYPSNKQGAFWKNNQAIQYPEFLREVVLSWEYTDVRSWWIVELLDPSMWSMGKYIVLPYPVSYRNISWNIDSIVLQVKKDDGQ